MTVTETTTLKHVVDLGERDAEAVVADIEEMLRRAKESVARGIKTLALDVEHEAKAFTHYDSSSGFTATGTQSVPARVTVTGTKTTTPEPTLAEALSPESAPETPAPTDPPA